jgi:hypothetical protein
LRERVKAIPRKLRASTTHKLLENEAKETEFKLTQIALSTLLSNTTVKREPTTSKHTLSLSLFFSQNNKTPFSLQTFQPSQIVDVCSANLKIRFNTRN